MRMTKLVMVMCGIALIGCAAGQSRTYDVTVENRTDRTVTLWLTKDGPPEEQGWRSPEQLAEHRQDGAVKYDMASVPPGRKADTGTLKGHFAGGTNAVLRVYDGAPDLSELMSGDKTRDRADYILAPGTNRLAVVDRDGKLNVLKE